MDNYFLNSGDDIVFIYYMCNSRLLADKYCFLYVTLTVLLTIISKIPYGNIFTGVILGIIRINHFVLLFFVILFINILWRIVLFYVAKRGHIDNDVVYKRVFTYKHFGVCSESRWSLLYSVSCWMSFFTVVSLHEIMTIMIIVMHVFIEY